LLSQTTVGRHPPAAPPFWSKLFCVCDLPPLTARVFFSFLPLRACFGGGGGFGCSVAAPPRLAWVDSGTLLPPVFLFFPFQAVESWVPETTLITRRLFPAAVWHSCTYWFQQMFFRHPFWTWFLQHAKSPPLFFSLKLPTQGGGEESRSFFFFRFHQGVPSVCFLFPLFPAKPMKDAFLMCPFFFFSSTPRSRFSFLWVFFAPFLSVIFPPSGLNFFLSSGSVLLLFWSVALFFRSARVPFPPPGPFVLFTLLSLNFSGQPYPPCDPFFLPAFYCMAFFSPFSQLVFLYLFFHFAWVPSRHSHSFFGPCLFLRLAASCREPPPSLFSALGRRTGTTTKGASFSVFFTTLPLPLNTLIPVFSFSVLCVSPKNLSTAVCFMSLDPFGFVVFRCLPPPESGIYRF